MPGPGGRRWALFGLLLLLAWSGSVEPGWASDTCPVSPPDDVPARVEARVEYRPDRRRFDYRYRILPEGDRGRGLATVALRGEPPLEDVRGPADGFVISTGPGRSRLFWDARLQSGSSLPGKAMEFALSSPNPPGVGTIRLLGHLDYGRVRRRVLAGRLPSTCRGLFSGGFRDQARAVSTVVPDTYVRAGVSVNPDDPGRTPAPGSGGEFPLALLGSDTLPLDKLAGNSVRVGPAMTKPRWGSGHRVDVNGDGRTDRLFHVRTDEAGLRCGQNHLVVTGWLETSNRVFLGRASVRPDGCS